MLLYVDYVLLAGHDKVAVNSPKEKFKSKFEMKNLKSARRILGMEIKRERTNGKLFLTQESYIEKIVKRFSLNEFKLVNLPLSACVKLSTDHSPKADDEFNRMANISYANVVSFVMYVMVCSKPDIAFIVSVLSRFMSNLGELHWEAM